MVREETRFETSTTALIGVCVCVRTLTSIADTGLHSAPGRRHPAHHTSQSRFGIFRQTGFLFSAGSPTNGPKEVLRNAFARVIKTLYGAA